MAPLKSCVNCSILKLSHEVLFYVFSCFLFIFPSGSDAEFVDGFMLYVRHFT